MRSRGSQFRVRFVVDGDGKIASSFEAVHAGASKARVPVEGLAEEVVKLSDRLDQGAAATRQYAQDQAVLDAAMKQGLITAREHTRLMDKAWQQTPDAQKWKDFGAKIGRSLMVVGGAYAAVTALVLRNTMQWENQLAQLDAAHASTANAVGMTRQQLVGLAEDLSRASTFGRAEIVEAETRLLSYSGIVGTNFPRAMQAVIDQSARLGISVAQSAETIGRALESPAKAAAALSDQGFGAAFTDEVRATIDALVDAGREADAQIMILEILEESYAGAAQAARDTFGGSLLALKNALGDLTTGDDGSLDGATEAVNDLIDALNDPQVQQGISDLVEGLLSITTMLAQATPYMATFASHVTDMAHQFGVDVGFMVEATGALLDLQLQLATMGMADGSVAEAAARLGRAHETRADMLGQRRAERAGAANLAAAQADYARFKAGIEYVDYDGPLLEPSRGYTRPASTTDPTTSPTGNTGATAVDDQARALEQLERRMESYLGRLEQANELHGDNTELARANYEIQSTGLDALNPALAESIRLEAALRDSQREKADLMAAGERTIASNRTALQRLNEELAKYDAQLAANAITVEDHATASARARAEHERSEERLRQANRTMTEAMLEDWSDLSRGMDYAMANSLDSISQGFADFATTGEADIRRLGATILETFARIMMDKAIADFIGAITGAGSGGGGASGGGFWQNVIGAFVGSFGNRAFGGGVSGGGLYEVAEHGRPEVLRQGSQTYLLPGSDGTVMPLQPMFPGGEMGGGGDLELHQYFDFSGSGGQGDARAGDVAAAQREFAERMRATAQEEIAHAMRPGGALWRAGVRRQ